MDFLSSLSIGLATATTPTNLALCFVGALLGTFIGVLPGVGPLATIAMLLPLTFGLDPASAIIMLAGIYYGAQYGGSTTAILVNLPGESSAVVTCIDGHQMARNGQAGKALGIAAIGSFIAGTFGTLFIALLAAPMASMALKFGAPEYFSLMIFGLIGAVVLASGSILNALAMIFLGLLVGMVGTDVTSGASRFQFGFPELADGIDFVPLALGLFGLGDVLVNLEHGGLDRSILTSKISSLLPNRQDIRTSLPAILRGTGIGTLLGLLPGGGAVLSSFTSYAVEKKLAADPSRFGKGAIEGVAGPESANNAGAQSSFIPMLTLGIPSNPLMALLVGALIVHGIQPGPQIMTTQPELFWGLIVSMWFGNLMLLVINLPLIGIWIKLLRVPYGYLFPAIVIFSSIGVYSLQASTFDVALTIFFGFFGYIFIKVGAEPAPLLIGFILGPLLEENLRRSLLLSQGDPTIFLTRPISAVCLAFAACLLVVTVSPFVRRKRAETFEEIEQ